MSPPQPGRSAGRLACECTAVVSRSAGASTNDSIRPSSNRSISPWQSCRARNGSGVQPTVAGGRMQSVRAPRQRSVWAPITYTAALQAASRSVAATAMFWLIEGRTCSGRQPFMPLDHTAVCGVTCHTKPRRPSRPSARLGAAFRGGNCACERVL